MIRTCIFDLGNVLVRFSHERMYRQIAELFDCDTRAIRSVLLDSELQWEFERGRITELEFHRRVVLELGRDVRIADLKRATADIFDQNDEMLPLLADVTRSGVRMIVLSNTCVTHFEWIRERYTVLNPFHHFVLSCDVGAIKPEAAMYTSAIETAGCRPDECFFTDDIEANIKAARRFGIQAELFHGADQLRRTLSRHGLVPVPV